MNSRVRRWVVAALVVISCLLLLLSTVGAWARTVVLDTERWIAVVGPLIEDPAVVRTVSARGAAEISVALDIPLSVRETLEPRMRTTIARVLETPEARTAWRKINLVTHRAVVALLRDEPGSGLSEQEGTVSLDVTPLIEVALRRSEGLLTRVSGRPIDVPDPEGAEPRGARRRIEAAIGTDLPDDFGQVVLFRVERLPAIQRVLAVVDGAITWLVVLTLAVIALTIAVSRSRRRTVIWLGIGTVISFTLLFVLTVIGRDGLVDSVSPEARGAVRSVVGQGSDNLGAIGVLVMLAGIGIVLVAVLAGRRGGRDRTA